MVNRRRLAAQRPAAFEADLATALGNLGTWIGEELNEVGDWRAARAPFDEASTMRRGMAAKSLCSWAARGPSAPFITNGHQLRMAQGEGSPLARLHDLDANVLLLGVDYNDNTCCHQAEYRSRHGAHRASRPSAAFSVDGHSTWVTYDDISWQDDDFLELGCAFEREPAAVRVGQIAGARAKLFSLRACVDFAVSWMDRNRTWCDFAEGMRALPVGLLAFESSQ